MAKFLTDLSTAALAKAVAENCSNDDRSDSINPNNDDYHAAMDNLSDQMNLNNDAYWSSRER